MYRFYELFIGLSDIGILHESLPEFASVDVDIATSVSLLVHFVSDTCAVEDKVEVGEVAAEFVRLFQIEARCGAVSSSRHRDCSRHCIVDWR